MKDDIAKQEEALRENIIIIFEKENNDTSKNHSWSLSNGLIVYNNYDTLLNLYSTISTNGKLKDLFVDIMISSILDSEYFEDRSHYSGYSQLAFYMLLNLGKVDEAIDKLNEINYQILLLPLFIKDLLISKTKYFNTTQLGLLKEFLIESKAHHGDFVVIDIFNLIVTDIINERFKNLKESLKSINIEINNDKKTVQDKINYLGFDDKLSRLLDEIDKYLLSDASEFVNAGMIGNLRVFMEDVFKDIANRISTKNGESIPKIEGRGEMGNVRGYLKNKLELHDNEDKFINNFINILHSEGGHAFVSEKEYFRLARNIAIEIALLFLSKYEKLLK